MVLVKRTFYVIHTFLILSPTSHLFLCLRSAVPTFTFTKKKENPYLKLNLLLESKSKELFFLHRIELQALPQPHHISNLAFANVWITDPEKQMLPLEGINANT